MIYTRPGEAATGANVKGVERSCRVEANEKVSGTLVTVPFPPIRHEMVGVGGQTAGAGSRYVGMTPTSVLRLMKGKGRYVWGFVIVV